MTSAAQVSAGSKVDWRIVVGGGARMGAFTAIGVVVFALLSGALAGMVETIVQSLLVLVGVLVFAYLPSTFLRPTDVDSISWVSLIGLLGSVFFTVVDTAILRPINLYDWSWDAIGGGSGFWYIPVWFMGSAVLAWLGAWIVANRGDQGVTGAGTVSLGIGVVVSAILMATGLVPFHAAGVALGMSLGLVVHVVISSMSKSG